MTEWHPHTSDGDVGAVMICESDSCGRRREFPMSSGSIDFIRGTTEARTEGWRVWTEDGTWRHLCPAHAVDSN